MFVVGVALAVLGAALFASAVIEMSRANSSTRLPMWSNPPRRPRSALVMRAGGAGLAVLGAGLAGTSIGYWSVLLVVAALAAGLVVQIHHNRTVPTRP